MAIDEEAQLIDILESFLSYVKETDLSIAKVNCEIIESLLHNDDGSDRLLSFEIKTSDNDTEAFSLPAISTAPLSLLYPSEVSFEIVGPETLRVYGTPLSEDKTEDLTLAGQELRKMTADYGYNTTIEITGKGNDTHLKFTIIKDGTSMTQFMEPWLENPTEDNLSILDTVTIQ